MRIVVRNNSNHNRPEVTGRTPETLLPDEVRISHAHKRRTFRDMAASANLRGRRKNGTEIELPIKLGPVVVQNGVYTIVCIRRTKE